MHLATEDSSRVEVAALTAILKVLARWAPHARHDVVGACSPISLDLSLLGVKSKRGPLSEADVATFIERGKENIKKTVEEINRLILLQRQDRQMPIAVSEMLEKMTQATRTVFAIVDWTPPEDPATLGTDSEYDLTMVIWATLMALFDRHGAGMQLRVEAWRDQGRLLLGFYVTPSTGDNGIGHAKPSASHEHISFNEVRHLAAHLGFAFGDIGGGIELVRHSAPVAT